jgi:aryl-alcohol dehydrogenase-like predicted oxidoreductase
MEKRMLGRSGIAVSPLAFGGNVFGWTIGAEQSYKILDAFTAAGFNFIDTADVYSNWAGGNKGGESETIIGNWLKKNGGREKIVIATKVGSAMGPGKKGTSKKYILQAVEDSLKRLQTDYIDLYQTHYDDESTPVEETLEAYTELVKAGKVKAAGTSNMSPQRLLESLEASNKHGYTRYESLQPEYNLFEREAYEKNYEGICMENQIGVISYYALASGFLTGKYRTERDLSKSPRGQGIRKYLNERGFRILKALDEVSAELNANPAQVSIAWLLARPSITAPIASATKIEQLNDLIRAVELKLPPAAIEKLNKASAY